MRFLSKIFEKNKPKLSQKVEADALANALESYINDYIKEHGSKPKGLFVDHNVNMIFAYAGFYANSRFGGIKLIPVANVPGGLTWKAMN